MEHFSPEGLRALPVGLGAGRSGTRWGSDCRALGCMGLSVILTLPFAAGDLAHCQRKPVTGEGATWITQCQGARQKTFLLSVFKLHLCVGFTTFLFDVFNSIVVISKVHIDIMIRLLGSYILGDAF